MTTQYFQTTNSLNPGLTYEFKVTARNSVGSSEYSAPIAILAAKPPDAPINFAEVYAQTTATQIGVQWDDGVYDGAAAVLSYQLWYKLASGSDWNIYSTSLLTKSDIVYGLTAGESYTFRVQSKNTINYSQYSVEIEL